MQLCGYQPQYFPRLHYFNRVLISDIFEISDYVQFAKKHAYPQSDGSQKRDKSYQADTVIKLNQGKAFLTIPVSEELKPINQIVISYSQNWVYKHLKSIEVGYSKALNLKKFYPEIEQLLSQEYANLSDLNMSSILWSLARVLSDESFDIKSLSIDYIKDLLKTTKHPFKLKEIFLASKSPVPPPQKGEANDWIIKLCQYAGADEYIFGGTSHSSYMDIDKFAKNNIKTVLQDWKCDSYHQQYPKVGFLQNLSIIDLIMNEDLLTRQKILE